MDITIAQEGWCFVLTCLERYQGEGCFLILFLCALAYLWLSNRKDKEKKEEKNIQEIDTAGQAMVGWVLPYVGVLVLTVFNILIMQVVVAKLGLENEYYRFIWLLPVTVVIGYASARAVVRRKGWIVRMAVILILAAVMIITGKTILARGFTLTENLYKIPDEVIEICDVIHQNSGEENPKVIAEFDLVVLLNQYDPSLSLEIAYGDVSTLRDVEKEPEKEWNRWLEARLTVMDVVMDRDVSTESLDFISAMDYTDASYLVSSKDAIMEAYYAQVRCVPIAETEHYIVYRYYNSILPMPRE